MNLFIIATTIILILIGLVQIFKNNFSTNKSVEKNDHSTVNNDEGSTFKTTVKIQSGRDTHNTVVNNKP